ncbi:MAG: DUF4440 domain-containing protein [Wenzhouxiangellaceae bacterium]|nr:DUF4440 domain-containing protein [Wenzhouxiangellaceae bacterium]
MPILMAVAVAVPAGAEEHGMDIEQRASAEIIELHRFFENWYRGRLEEREIARFERALGEDFTIVLPGAEKLSRGRILEAVREARGSDENARIRIDNVRVHQFGPGFAVATYEEWQALAGAPERGRLSTVVFGFDDAAPNGLVWLHVHETWLPERQDG